MATKTKTARKNTRGSKRTPSLRLVPSSHGGTMLELRSRLGLSRDVFARLLPISTRSLATLESGKEPSDAVRRRMTELRRIVDALEEVIVPEAIGEWMITPNDAFDGLKPLEVMERGEVDRIWQMIFVLRSGMPR